MARIAGEAALDEVEVTKEQVRPGTIAKNRKTPWTQQDINKLPTVTFIPDETVPITFQGMPFRLEADKEITIPQVVKLIYDNYKRSKRREGTPPPCILFSPGVGGLEQS